MKNVSAHKSPLDNKHEDLFHTKCDCDCDFLIHIYNSLLYMKIIVSKKNKYSFDATNFDDNVYYGSALNLYEAEFLFYDVTYLMYTDFGRVISHIQYLMGCNSSINTTF